uniref:Uncharacterized protein n=1 Tax=uncultured marine group II/III euryarchaeote AD1000_80_C01 TaxID=1457813 RepID=A0A075FZ79_9EURY|nr:hypothetical protein [uncultured marine group II/III euryarchaeote AD1000_80_C01]
MSGGLLEKAQSQDEGVVAAVEDVEGTSGGGLLERASSEGSLDSGSSFDSTMVKKGVAASVVALLILFVAYQAVMGFSFGGYSISVSDVDVDDSDNTLGVEVFIGTPMFKSSPSGDMSMTISNGTADVWTGTFPVSSKLSWYDVPLADFYQGNSRAAAEDGSNIDYTITVELEGSSSESYAIPGEISDRTINTVDGELNQVTELCDCEEKNDLDHLGVKFRVGMGALDPVESNTSNLMMHINSDYTVDAQIIHDGSSVFSFPTITVDGDAASWNGGAGTVENAWIDLDGEGSYTDLFEETVSFIPRDDFYEGDDGCYTIEITVVHTPPFGDDITGVSSQGWKFWWEYNENRDTQPNDENNDGDIDPPTEGTDPYKSPETC